MRFRRVLLFVMLFALGACKKTTTTPTDTTQEPYSATDVYTGTVSPGGSQLHAFNVPVQATVAVTFASLKLAGTDTTLSVPLALLLGAPSADGTTCTGTTTTTSSPALTQQLSQALPPGGYCVSITATGGLPGSADYAVRVHQSTGETATGTAGTERFSSNLYPAGRVTRTLATGQAGDLIVKVTNVEPSASFGLGLGIAATSADCRLTQSVTTTAGSSAELSAKADPGTYCVSVFDAGALPGRVTFFIDITHQ